MKSIYELLVIHKVNEVDAKSLLEAYSRTVGFTNPKEMYNDLDDLYAKLGVEKTMSMFQEETAQGRPVLVRKTQKGNWQEAKLIKTLPDSFKNRFVCETKKGALELFCEIKES